MTQTEVPTVQFAVLVRGFSDEVLVSTLHMALKRGDQLRPCDIDLMRAECRSRGIYAEGLH
ncbi:hypothetical protein [Aquibium sp. ELW1220]|uniref:hypothetical protein n=1 Tax=Aquibium sp. ELW1220 TaxID=2976766 RepID=UPI0025B0B509|nr:hypothetical protein [Aquibium sp. ELW1220]MDN2579188.1 hypothetical protein [Aquibium sp. ELW1220]